MSDGHSHAAHTKETSVDAAVAEHAHAHKIGLMSLVVLGFFWGSGGMYGTFKMPLSEESRRMCMRHLAKIGERW